MIVFRMVRNARATLYDFSLASTARRIFPKCSRSSSSRVPSFVEDHGIQRMSRGRQATELSRELGRRVKALRVKRGWKQADLSAHTGLDRGHISEIENGKRMMNLLTLQIVAKGL